jgi:xylan 1,4-beta-xylosidase
LKCSCIPARQVTIKTYRIDAEHSNSYEVWKNMGSPQQPTAEQIAQLEKAGQLEQVSNATAGTKNGLLQLNLQLPRQGIFFVKMEW